MTNSLLALLLAMLHLAAAVGKLVDGHSSEWSSLPWWLYYGVAALESGLALALLQPRLRRIAAGISLGACCAGMLVLVASKGHCGCFGRHVTMAAPLHGIVLGAYAATSWWILAGSAAKVRGSSCLKSRLS